MRVDLTIKFNSQALRFHCHAVLHLDFQSGRWSFKFGMPVDLEVVRLSTPKERLTVEVAEELDMNIAVA